MASIARIELNGIRSRWINDDSINLRAGALGLYYIRLKLFEATA